MILKFNTFSCKQLKVLSWWHKGSEYCNHSSIICDGAIRSGKTICMGISFVSWAFYKSDKKNFGICGKTIKSIRRNLISTLLPTLLHLGFGCNFKVSENLIEITYCGRTNFFYLFGGKDENSASLIQGVTLEGVLFDEVALMPQSFVEQALARCSAEDAKFFFNCNPEYPGHWFYQDWIIKAKQKNALYLHFRMDDNPSLSKKVINRYKNLYTGTFYERFVEGKWTCAFGAIYPFMNESDMYFDRPDAAFEKYYVSCDYGTVNPASFGLWGKSQDLFYRIDEYYYDSRKEGAQKTDEEHYQSLCELTKGLKIEKVVVDPSAASFITLIKRYQEFEVLPAYNNVVNGIREVSSALKNKKIRICKNCVDSVREFSLYRWENSYNKDIPIKENDHAMDDIRYFVATILNDKRTNKIEDFFSISTSRF